MGEIIAFANAHPLLASLVVALLVAALGYEVWLRSRSLAQVSTNMAVQLINKGATIIDVRSTEAYARGHIVNSRHVPLEKIESEPGVIKKNKSKVLVTVCDNGAVAQRAANALRNAGYEAVYALRGGLTAWRTDNLPLVK